MKLKFNKLDPRAVTPVMATEGSACFDLVGITRAQSGETMRYKTGLAFEVPPGYVMLVFSRSGHGFNQDIRLANCVGVIDSDYRGEIAVKLTRDDVDGEFPHKGDRVAQAMFLRLPKIELQEVNELTKTERGNGGFGSTGA
ncbi:MAG: dUTP diphosphatase [Thermoproteota archaeon]|nr:MAG: dUTP diphosphatase [Candidatus Korarchaeota archaeon]